MTLRTLQILCAGLVAGLLLSSAVLGGLTYAGTSATIPALLAPLAGVVALSLPSSVLLGIAIKSSLFYQARMDWLRNTGQDQTDAIGTFSGPYTRGTLIQIIPIEIFGLIGTGSAFVTGELLFLIAPMLAVLGIGLLFPTKSKLQTIATHLSRPAEERELRLIEALQLRDSE